jgi:hypothetical protein
MPLPKEQKEKGRMLRTSSLVLLIFSHPGAKDHIPTPPRAMTKRLTPPVYQLRAENLFR